MNRQPLLNRFTCDSFLVSFGTIFIIQQFVFVDKIVRSVTHLPSNIVSE